MNAELTLGAGARTFLDGPNIVSLSLATDRDGDTQAIRIGLDIWHRDHGILPLTGPSRSVPEGQLVAGVTDHIAERFALESVADAPGIRRSSIGVGEVFEAAATQGIQTLVLQGSVPGSLPYGAMAAALIEAAVASGDAVVIPAQPVLIDDAARVGWWRIDPATGVTTDVMDDGSGQEVVEYTTLQTGQRQWFRCYGAMANWAAGLIIAAGEMVSALPESAIWRLFNRPPGWQGTFCHGL
jgi:hypothetical protein